MRINGFGFERGDDPPTSARLAATWRPYVETCTEAFGLQRCVFESNFPVDKGSYSYGACWNAFKLLTPGASLPIATLCFVERLSASTDQQRRAALIVDAGRNRNG